MALISTTPIATAADQPTKASSNVFRFSLVRPPQVLSMVTYVSLQEWYIHRNITGTLVTLSEEGEIKSGLAEEVRTSNGGLDYRFKLRPNIRWSNGDPLTVEDIVASLTGPPQHNNATLLRTLLKKGPVSRAIFSERNDTLVIRLRKPFSRLLYYLSAAEYGVIDTRSLKTNDKLRLGLRTSGPYRVKELSDTRLTLEANPFDKRLSASNPHSVNFDLVASHEELVARITKGELDFAELADDIALGAAHRSGSYNLLDGALDNLATIQSRKLGKNERLALRDVARAAREGVLLTDNRVRASAYFPMSNATAHISRTEPLTIKQLREKYRGKVGPIVIVLGPNTTNAQRSDAHAIANLASEANLLLTVRESEAEFTKDWEAENYTATLSRMGVYGEDEAEVMNGYFCAGFKPYQSLSQTVCEDLRKAIRFREDTSRVAKHLGRAYSSLERAGWIVPLYHFPRRFALSTRWKTHSQRLLSPFPDLLTIEAASETNAAP